MPVGMALTHQPLKGCGGSGNNNNAFARQICAQPGTFYIAERKALDLCLELALCDPFQTRCVPSATASGVMPALRENLQARGAQDSAASESWRPPSLRSAHNARAARQRRARAAQAPASAVLSDDP